MLDEGSFGGHPTPSGPWGRVWITTLVAAALLLGGLELFWRSRGYLASISSYEPLWSFHRERLIGTDRSMIALLGGSRMQIGFRPEAFHEVLPDIGLAQLADAGKPAFATLRDLARDESFRGLVLCSMPEISTVPGWNDQAALVRYFHQQWTPGEKYSLLLSVPLQAELALLQPRLRGAKLVGSLEKGRLPPLNYHRVAFDRSWQVFLEMLPARTIRGLVEARIKESRQRLPALPPAPRELWDSYTGRMIEFADRIASRGGQVVFVDFPIRGRFRRLIDEYFPRSEYWDGLAAAGVETLHWEDMPNQSELGLPDQSHLDLLSGREFTRWIARELVARGVV